MKLFELDQSDFQMGDQNNPRSPYYKDPLKGGVPDAYQPEVPMIRLVQESGTSPNTQEQYNVVLRCLWDTEQNNQAGAFVDIATNALASVASELQLVDEQDGEQDGESQYVQFYAGDPSRVTPERITALQRSIRSSLQEYSDQIARKGAESSISQGTFHNR